MFDVPGVPPAEKQQGLRDIASALAGFSDIPLDTLGSEDAFAAIRGVAHSLEQSSYARQLLSSLPAH
jgi:hypothetical protein